MAACELNMSADLDHRLTELETRIAFIESTMQALDTAVANQDRFIIQIQREFESLRGDLAQVRVALADDTLVDPPPPHY